MESGGDPEALQPVSVEVPEVPLGAPGAHSGQPLALGPAANSPGANAAGKNELPITVRPVEGGAGGRGEDEQVKSLSEQLVDMNRPRIITDGKV